MMKQQSLQDLHPFHIPGMIVRAYDPRNYASVSWWGQQLNVSFSNPVGDVRYQNMDIVLTFNPDNTGLLGSLWTDDTPIRRQMTCSNSDMSFFVSAISLYQDEMANRIKGLLDRILRRVLMSYLSQTTKISYDFKFKPNMILVSALMADRGTDQIGRFVVGYHFEDEVFYVRYVLEDSLSRGERQEFDSNDPLREVLVQMCQSLLVDMRKRGWTS